MTENRHNSPDQLSPENMSADPALEAAREQGHEGDGLHVRTIVITAVSLFLLAVVSLGIVSLIMRSRSQADASHTTAAEEWRAQAVDPGVTPDQTAMRTAAERQLQQQLSSYAWQDSDHKFARIPIERAMSLLAERKLQVLFAPSSTSAGNPKDSSPTLEAKP
ncbi:MAG: hypothetical protein KDA52_06820 [Planctomycetaceae bacterium]|nr:hypothetical protein [Planctomycetaceae bacterium]